MNYGLVSAVLLNKIALSRLERTAAATGVEIYPILGIGSAPFRGNFTPHNVDRCARGVPFRVTRSPSSPRSSTTTRPPPSLRLWRTLMLRETSSALAVDEERCLDVVERYSAAYQSEVTDLAPLINDAARHVPSRRKRKLHVGLFGYSRSVAG